MEVESVWQGFIYVLGKKHIMFCKKTGITWQVVTKTQIATIQNANTVCKTDENDQLIFFSVLRNTNLGIEYTKY